MTGLPSISGTSLPRTLPRSRHISWGDWPPAGSHVYDGDVSFAKVHQLKQLAIARWKADHPDAAHSDPPARALYFYTRLCLRELLVDMHGSEANAKEAVKGKSMLQVLAPSADLSWMHGVDSEEQEAQRRRNVLQWEQEFNAEHGVWGEGLPQDLTAYELFLDEQEQERKGERGTAELQAEKR